MAINLNNAAYLRDKVQAAKNKYANPVQQPAVQQPVKPAVQPVQTGSPVQKAQQQPTYTTMGNQAPKTNYGGQGNPYNEIAYLKNLYETSKGKGTQSWAANEAKKYYGMLDPDEAKKVSGLNAFQLKNYIGQMKTNEQNKNPDYWEDKSSGYINDMYDQQRRAQMEQIQAQRDKAIGMINQQKAELAPQYANMRNQTDVVNAQNVSKLRELMASQGLSGSGENVTSSVALNSARQGALNQLNTQEQQQRNDYDRRISDINNPSEMNALIAQLEAERSRALLEGRYRSEDKAYQRERDQVGDSRYDQEWDYQKGRDAVEDTRWNKQFEQDNKRYAEEKAWREYTYRNMSASEKKNFEIMEKQFGEDMAWKMYQMNYQGELQKSLAQSEIDFYKNSGFNSGGEGGGYTRKASGSPNQSYQGHLNKAIQSGAIPKEWAGALTELVGRESSWNPTAKNPKSTAHGYGQFLKSTRSDYEKKTGLDYDNPVHQLIMMAQYVKDRYGTPEKALAFWDKNRWY
jgi:hypothetical protein